MRHVLPLVHKHGHHQAPAAPAPGAARPAPLWLLAEEEEEAAAADLGEVLEEVHSPEVREGHVAVALVVGGGCVCVCGGGGGLRGVSDVPGGIGVRVGVWVNGGVGGWFAAGMEGSVAWDVPMLVAVHWMCSRFLLRSKVACVLKQGLFWLRGLWGHTPS
jgi:hypothetical protein